jgi:hypothetical protein
MKAFIIIMGLIGFGERSLAQQNGVIKTNNKLNDQLTSNILPTVDTAKLKNALGVKLLNSPSPDDDRFYSKMPVVKLKGEDKMPVYYSATDDRMPIKNLRMGKGDLVKNNFFVPVQIPEVIIPQLPVIKVK